MQENLTKTLIPARSFFDVRKYSTICANMIPHKTHEAIAPLNTAPGEIIGGILAKVDMKAHQSVDSLMPFRGRKVGDLEVESDLLIPFLNVYPQMPSSVLV